MFFEIVDMKDMNEHTGGRKINKDVLHSVYLITYKRSKNTKEFKSIYCTGRAKWGYPVLRRIISPPRKKYMKRMKHLVYCVLAAFILTACQSYKKVPYLQDAEVVLYSTQDAQLYDAKIMPKDLLTIVVSCTSPELAAPFNLTVATQSNTTLSTTTTQPVLQQYLVDNDGNINFPVLGELHVGGLTKKATEQMIVEKLKPYITETPIVTVRMVNYKISVIGEVARPGTFTISNEKVNVLEALAMAGDMTVYGLRDDVKLIRENANGKQEIIPLDLNKAETILSPYYYLQQNDIIYVTPNKAKARNSDIGTSTSLWFSATSILVSIASLLFNILK